MLSGLLNYLEYFNDLLWSHVNFIIIIALGIFFTIKSKFFQLKAFPKALSIFKDMLSSKNENHAGVHPLKAFSAAIGGCIGIGNVVGICTAIQIGGPGALFWVWVAGFLGMLLKYSEVYLGMKTRVPNGKGGFDGGPMYFLNHAYKKNWAPITFCILMCLYGVEIYMFGAMSDSLSQNWNIPKIPVILALLALVLFAASGGVKRVSEICAKIMPVFLILYVAMSLWVIGANLGLIPTVLYSVFKGAFTAQSAVGGFVGSSLALTISMGMSRGCYSGDIGIGYASVIHAESSETKPSRQASLGVLGIFLDTFVVCTLSIMLVLITGAWNASVDSLYMVQTALSYYFPYMEIFMPLFIFLLGYSTIIAFFTVGIKCARHLSPSKGTKIYYTYAVIAFPLFAMINSSQALTIMSLCGGFLLILNLSGIYLLRNEITFEIEKKPAKTPSQANISG